LASALKSNTPAFGAGLPLEFEELLDAGAAMQSSISATFRFVDFRTFADQLTS